MTPHSQLLRNPVMMRHGDVHGYRSLSFSADGALLACEADSQVLVWNVHDRSLRFAGDSDQERCMFLHGGQLAVASAKEVRIQEIDGGTGRTLVQLDNGIGAWHASPTDSRLAFVSSEEVSHNSHRSICEVWDFKTRSRVFRFVDEEFVNLGAVALAADGRCAVSGLVHLDRDMEGFDEEGDTVAMLSAAGVPIWRRRGEVLGVSGAWSLTFLEQERVLAVTHGDSVTLWDSHTGDLQQRLREPLEPEGSYVSLHSSALVERERLLINCGDRSRLPESALVITSALDICAPGVIKEAEPEEDELHNELVKMLTPDSLADPVVRAFAEPQYRYEKYGYVSFWDLKSDWLLERYLFQGRQHLSMAVSPCGRKLAIGAWEGVVLFDLA